MPARILVVDDEPHYLEGHILALKEAGYEVDVLENAEDAIEKLKHSPAPSLIILDLIMPLSRDEIGPENGMNTGLHLLDEIRSELGLVVPIIMLTVVANQEVHEQIESLEDKFGHEAIIRVKPFLPSELLDDVQAQLKSGTNLTERQQ